jgi:hypothetical protein
MNPMVVSAKFAAYVWFTKGKPDTGSVRAAANNFANTNWTAFLPCAHKGLGRLLMRIAKYPASGRMPRAMVAVARC